MLAPIQTIDAHGIPTTEYRHELTPEDVEVIEQPQYTWVFKFRSISSPSILLRKEVQIYSDRLRYAWDAVKTKVNTNEWALIDFDIISPLEFNEF